MVTHGLFLGDFLQDKTIERFLIANTIPLSDEIDHSRIDVCSVAGIFGKAIRFIINNESISSLFRPEKGKGHDIKKELYCILYPFEEDLTNRENDDEIRNHFFQKRLKIFDIIGAFLEECNKFTNNMKKTVFI